MTSSPGLHDRRDGVEDGFGAAGRDGDFGVRDRSWRRTARELGRDGLPQRRHALHRRVLVAPLAHVLRDGVDQRRIAVEVGKSLRQVDRPESAASFDMTVKIVVPTLGSFD